LRSEKKYSKIADIYQHLMRKVNYDIWAEYLYMILKPHVPPNPNVLEIAGGEGNIAFYLEKEYNSYLLTDLSHEMLQRSESNLQKTVCDVRALPFKMQFDLVLMIFDSINYLLTKKDLEAAFRNAAKVLKPGGLFAFDASLEENSLKHIIPVTCERKYGKIKYTHISAYNPVTKVHKNEFLIHDLDGRTYREVHKQKIYTQEDFFLAIEKSGLHVMHCYDCFTVNKPRKNSKRIQFILRKSYKHA